MNTLYIVSKLFTYLVLPPGIFILLFLFASFFMRKFRFFFMMCGFCFYALSNSYVADSLLTPLEKPYNIPLQASNVDAVVVLGGGSHQGVANLPLSDEANKRALWAIMIAKKLNLPVLFSGAGANQIYSESSAFLDTAKAIQTYFSLEIPQTVKLSEKQFSMHMENKSLDTYENAKLCQHMFEQDGILHPTIYLVTSAYHMRRSIALYEHFGFTVIPAATSFKISSQEKDFWDYLPNMWALEKSYIALHEYVGLLSLTLRGI
ncbi:MAG: YdcF family protein [Sulfurospirillaceae bacterium]|nr:YdcF family protein [Sulfurospirillaceae bacterium]